MSAAYSALGLAVIALGVGAGLVGLLSWQRNRPSIAFWYLLRVEQVVTGAFVLYACFLYVTGHRADDDLHYLYVLLPVVASFMAELMRAGSASQELGDRLSPTEPRTNQELSEMFAALEPDEQEEIGLAIIRRETIVMTVACLVTAFLVWRALETTAGMF